MNALWWSFSLLLLNLVNKLRPPLSVSSFTKIHTHCTTKPLLGTHRNPRNADWRTFSPSDYTLTSRASEFCLGGAPSSHWPLQERLPGRPAPGRRCGKQWAWWWRGTGWVAGQTGSGGCTPCGAASGCWSPTWSVRWRGFPAFCKAERNGGGKRKNSYLYD